MKMKRLFSALLPCALVFMGIQGCSDDNNGEIPDKEVICTMDFRSVFVYVEDQSGNPFLLDSICSIYGGEALIAQKVDPEVYANISVEDGYGYPVIDDSHQKIFKGLTDSVEFKGFLGGMEVVSGYVVVTADECHVSSPESDRVLVADFELIACTEEFRTNMVLVKDSEGNPYLLDSISSTFGDNVLIAEKISPESIFEGSEGYYPVVDDGSRALFVEEPGTVTFKGFKAGKEVVTGDVEVTADLCHIQMFETIPTFTVQE